MKDDTLIHQHYLYGFAASALLIVGLTFLVNYLVDPLWYGKGNRITGQTYVFNERFGKANRFRRAPERYDCLIFGSSRVTLLQTADFEDYRCFNFAFSAALPAEILDYARFARALGSDPEIVIVGVDARDFWRRGRESKTPDFVLKKTDPPSIFKTYLSLDTLGFSIRTLLRLSPYPRFYRADYACDILPSAPAYRPPDCTPVEKQTRRYKSITQGDYEKLTEVWPDATYIGYVPMVSPWHVAPLYLDGTLRSYFDVIYSTARPFDRFYDLTIPSAVSEGTTRTYDGEHYDLNVQKRIAEILANDQLDFGVALHRISKSDYEREYRHKLVNFIDEYGIEPKPKKDCPTDVAQK